MSGGNVAGIFLDFEKFLKKFFPVEISHKKLLFKKYAIPFGDAFSFFTFQKNKREFMQYLFEL